MKYLGIWEIVAYKLSLHKETVMEFRNPEIKSADRLGKKIIKKSGKKKPIPGSPEAIEQSVKYARKHGLDLTFLK